MASATSELVGVTKPETTPDPHAPSGPGLRSFDESLPMALMRARESVMRRFRPILAEHNVSEQQWRVLRALDHAETPISVGELAERTFLLGPSLSRMLVGLEERSMISRRPANDARRSEIVIAPGGRAVVAAVAPKSEAAYTEISRHLDAGELADLHRLLARLAATADGGPPTAPKQSAAS